MIRQTSIFLARQSTIYQGCYIYFCQMAIETPCCSNPLLSFTIPLRKFLVPRQKSLHIFSSFHLLHSTSWNDDWNIYTCVSSIWTFLLSGLLWPKMTNTACDSDLWYESFWAISNFKTGPRFMVVLLENLWLKYL